MSLPTVSPPRERVQTAFELYEFAAQQIRRRAVIAAGGDPDVAAEQAIRQWHRRRPGAEAGDGPQPSRAEAGSHEST